MERAPRAALARGVAKLARDLERSETTGRALGGALEEAVRGRAEAEARAQSETERAAHAERQLLSGDMLLLNPLSQAVADVARRSREEAREEASQALRRQQQQQQLALDAQRAATTAERAARRRGSMVLAEKRMRQEAEATVIQHTARLAQLEQQLDYQLGERFLRRLGRIRLQAAWDGYSAGLALRRRRARLYLRCVVQGRVGGS
jgi:hypothetical protein